MCSTFIELLVLVETLKNFFQIAMAKSTSNIFQNGKNRQWMAEPTCQFPVCER